MSVDFWKKEMERIGDTSKILNKDSVLGIEPNQNKLKDNQITEAGPLGISFDFSSDAVDDFVSLLNRTFFKNGSIELYTTDLGGRLYLYFRNKSNGNKLPNRFDAWNVIYKDSSLADELYFARYLYNIMLNNYYANKKGNQIHKHKIIKFRPMSSPTDTFYDSFTTAKISIEHINSLDNFNSQFLNNKLFMSHYLFEQIYAQMHHNENYFWVDLSPAILAQGGYDPFNSNKIDSNHAYYAQAHKAALQKNLDFLGYTYIGGSSVSINETDEDSYIHIVKQGNKYQATYLLKKRLIDSNFQGQNYYSFEVEEYQGAPIWPNQTIITEEQAINKP